MAERRTWRQSVMGMKGEELVMRRRAILDEILITEEHYVRDLKLAIEVRMTESLISF